MLNICIVFAQLERETIQKRVSDAYYSRSQKGFRMGGKPPYGYRLEEILMEGIHTKKLVEEPGEAAIVREIFDMYEQPDTSYGDITRYYAEKGVQFYGKELIRSMLAHRCRSIKFLCRRDKFHLILLKQIHHIGKIQNRTADPVQLIHDHFLHFPSADICQKLLKLWSDCILAAVTLILVLFETSTL